MNDGLGYIRTAIAKEGDAAQVEVVRWEKDHKTGYYSKPFKVLMKADIALRELQKPITKRSRIWQYIRPLGITMDGSLVVSQSSNRLNSPDLIQKLKEELRAELQAEMAASVEEKPKRKKKAEEATEETPEANPSEDQNIDITSL
jgi:hypothetical protein